MSDYDIDNAWTRRQRRIEEAEFLKSSERFRKHLMAIVLICSVLTGGGLAYIYKSKESLDNPLTENIINGYNDHLKMLENTKKNLNSLTEYVENQSKRLRSTNKLLTELEKQRARLKPLLETELDTVNTLFRAQDERLRSQRLWDIIIAFVSGIFASIAAMALWTLGTDWLRKRQTKTAENRR